jgi:RNA polymerase subunit RPABC4/transcription elongation factor Spt4
MSGCSACGERVSSTAKYCRMCGHPLVARWQAAGSGEDNLGEPSSRVGQDEDDETTLSGVTDVQSPASSVTATVCDICGEVTDAGAVLCATCTQLLASSERGGG